MKINYNRYRETLEIRFDENEEPSQDIMDKLINDGFRCNGWSFWYKSTEDEIEA